MWTGILPAPTIAEIAMPLPLPGEDRIPSAPHRGSARRRHRRRPVQPRRRLRDPTPCARRARAPAARSDRRRRPRARAASDASEGPKAKDEGAEFVARSLRDSGSALRHRRQHARAVGVPAPRARHRRGADARAPGRRAVLRHARDRRRSRLRRRHRSRGHRRERRARRPHHLRRGARRPGPAQRRRPGAPDAAAQRTAARSRTPSCARSSSPIRRTPVTSPARCCAASRAPNADRSVADGPAAVSERQLRSLARRQPD